MQCTPPCLSCQRYHYNKHSISCERGPLEKQSLFTGWNDKISDLGRNITIHSAEMNQGNANRFIRNHCSMFMLWETYVNFRKCKGVRLNKTYNH